jgi:hypothetical protein
MPDDGVVVAVRLQRAQYAMANELGEELRLDQQTLIEHAITELFVHVQLQKAAARIR